jgi:hypothetical protein
MTKSASASPSTTFTPRQAPCQRSRTTATPRGNPALGSGRKARAKEPSQVLAAFL